MKTKINEKTQQPETAFERDLAKMSNHLLYMFKELKKTMLKRFKKIKILLIKSIHQENKIIVNIFT
jgi:hypothetical protein